MAKPVTPDPERDQRIAHEIVVDAHHSEERAMGGYAYLEDELRFPFTACCIVKRARSPLQVNDKVEVLDLASAEACEHEIFVAIAWERHGLAVALMPLEPIAETDDHTQQTVADWHDWVNRGYEEL
ncbi:MAG: calcium-binding protein [Gammaproteobacteria bacterium]